MLNNPIIGGKKLPTLSNPGTAGDLLTGKQLIDQNGNVLTGTIPLQSGATITPGTSSKTAVAAGRYTTGAVTVAGDTDLVAANIKSGVNIFGVTGSFEGGTSLSTHTSCSVTSTNGTTIYFTIANSVDPSTVPMIELYRTKFMEVDAASAPEAGAQYAFSCTLTRYSTVWYATIGALLYGESSGIKYAKVGRDWAQGPNGVQVTASGRNFSAKILNWVFYGNASDWTGMTYT